MPAGVYVRKSLRERFCERVSPEALTGCHLWTAGVDRKGYGKFWFDGATRVATHAAWMLAYGHRPDGFILHTCDTPSCVNPDHLFIGTAADNIADKVAKNRQAKGESMALAKLTEQDVRHIRCANQSLDDLATVFGVHRTLIWQVKAGKIWKHVC